jgi:ketosteroid isomerase-like protein
VTGTEVLRRYVDAVNRRDLPAMLAVLDPDVELSTRKGVLRGHDGVRAWLGEPYKELDVERVVDRMQVAGHVVVASGRIRHRWRESGEVADESDVAILAHIEDDRIVRLQTFEDEAAALAAAGLPAEDAAP